MRANRQRPGRDSHADQVAHVEQSAADAGLLPGRGLTTSEVARRYRVGEDRVRAWIHSGALGALNTSDVGCARPRYVVLPEHLAQFERARSTAPTPKPTRRPRSPGERDFYPDGPTGSREK